MDKVFSWKHLPLEKKYEVGTRSLRGEIGAFRMLVYDLLGPEKGIKALNDFYADMAYPAYENAKARGIKDNDVVLVYNDHGKAVMPAYVTSRIMPGVVAIHHGGKYIPDESGVDLGASPSTVLGGDFESCITPLKATSLVQIEKYQGESQ